MKKQDYIKENGCANSVKGFLLIIIAVIVVFIFGCGNPYPKPIVLIEIGGKNDNVDSLTLIRDTIRIYYSNLIKNDTVLSPCKIPKPMWDCLYIIKNPYKLIKWNDKTYGILFIDKYTNWYKVREQTHHDFTSILEEGEHFKDSCEAKQNLKQFLESRPTYKIVK